MESVRSTGQKIGVIWPWRKKLASEVEHELQYFSCSENLVLSEWRICVLACSCRATTQLWGNIRNLPTTLSMSKNLCTSSSRLQTTCHDIPSGRLRVDGMSCKPGECVPRKRTSEHCSPSSVHQKHDWLFLRPPISFFYQNMPSGCYVWVLQSFNCLMWFLCHWYYYFCTENVFIVQKWAWACF